MLTTLLPAAADMAAPTTGQIFWSEFLGTAVLLLLGGGVVATNLLPKSKGKDGGWLLINWGWGLAVFAGVYVAFRTGGHLNPAVTIAKVVAHMFDSSVTLAGDIPVTGTNVAVYIVAQFLGAFAGAVLCWLTFKKHFDEDLDPATTSYPVLPDGTIDLGAYAAGSVTVDLRRVAWDADGDKDAAVRIVMGAGRVLVKTGEGQPVRVDGHAEAGEFGTEFTSAWETNFPADDEQWPAKTYTVQGEELPLSHTWWPLNHSRSEAVSPAAKDRHGLISVDAEVGAGAIKAEETSSQVSWTGSTQAGTWVVSSWTDPSSGHHSGDELPVTGMTHPAVGTDVAESCLSRVMGDDEPRRARWSDVSGLSEATRSAYEGCLTTAWDREERARGSAPTATPSPTTSARPTDAPSPTPTH